MAGEAVKYGATWGDAAIHALDFAREDPFTFVLVCVPILFIAALAYKIFVAGPIGSLKGQFDSKRSSAKAAAETGERNG